MKVLMITEKDAANLSLAAIEKAYRRKGHTVDIYAPYLSENVMRMFDGHLKIRNINELTKEIIYQYDFIFTSVFSMLILKNKDLLWEKKYIFTYDFYVHGEVVNGGDFNFAPSLYNTSSIYYKELGYPKMGIGEPKFDLYQIARAAGNMFLFIDSGHYPFGKEGKVELAKLLLSICKKFPDYELCIKPRFLPTDEFVTHVNAVHLYDVIKEQSNGALPKNLNMLNQHLDLEELIARSKTVLCLYTTAYISALVARKGLIIIDGLPNEDCYDVRNKRFMQTREGMKGSQALVDYRQVCDYLPNGVQSPDSHVQKEITNTENVADKIVDVTEHIFLNLLAKGQFPPPMMYTYESYKEDIVVKAISNWNKVISQRMERTLKQRLFIYFDYRVNARLNLNFFTKYVNTLKEEGLINERVFNEAIDNVKYLISDILIDNENNLIQDEIDQGILIEALYTRQKYEKIREMQEINLGAYYLFRGKLAFDERDVSLAIEMLNKYIMITSERFFVKEVSDQPHYRAIAYHTLVRLYLEQKDYANANHYLKLYEKYNPQKSTHLSAMVTRELAYNELYHNWIKAVSEGKLSKAIESSIVGQVMIYGAGTVTENLVLSTEPLMKKVALFIDQNSVDKGKFGFPLISPGEIINYTDIKTVLVTVPHAYEQIRENLLMIRNDLKVICIDELTN